MTEEAQEPGEWRVVQASEILEKIEKGEPVEFDRVIIEDDLDLSKLDLPIQHIEEPNNHRLSGPSPNIKLIASKIKISNSRINGEMTSASLIFQKSISIEGTQFKEDVDFTGSQFSEYSDFSRAIFKSVYFLGTTFDIAYFKP